MPPAGIVLFWLGRTQFPRHKCLRGIPDDLTAFHLSNLLIVEPATVVADYEPRPHTILKRTTRVRLNIGWGARIRTMIKRTKISCPTIRRHPKSKTDYNHICNFCNKKLMNLFCYALSCQTILSTLYKKHMLLKKTSKINRFFAGFFVRFLV